MLLNIFLYDAFFTINKKVFPSYALDNSLLVTVYSTEDVIKSVENDSVKESNGLPITKWKQIKTSIISSLTVKKITLLMWMAI